MAFVYVIATNKNGCPVAPIKIGHATNPRKRVAQIQTACPSKIELYAAIDCGVREPAVFVEKQAHKHFSRDRLNGEWFDVDPDDARKVIEVILNIAVQVTLHEFMGDK